MKQAVVSQPGSIVLPCTVDLRVGKNKQVVDDLIAQYGQSKDVNEVGLEVSCRKDELNFRIIQFNSSRHLVRITASH